MSLNKSTKLPLRLGVGIVLLNSENKVFVGKRIDNPANFWQLPQGGVDKNEDLLCAARRELKEETNVESIELIKQIDDWLTYELPKNLHFHQPHLVAFAKNFEDYLFFYLQKLYFDDLVKQFPHQFLRVIV